METQSLNFVATVTSRKYNRIAYSMIMQQVSDCYRVVHIID